MKKFLLILVSLVLLVSLCSCAEVIDGILCDLLGVTNSHEHSFGEWETKTSATCESAEVEVRKCECGEEETREGDAALGHDAGTEWLNDDSNHWNLCANGCGEVMNKSAHSGGNATETEQATCETCGVKYGGFADHVHAFTEWESISPATCDKDEVLYRKCNCGVEETKTGVAALGHDVQTKFDENNHWTECVHNCGLSTDAEAHFGGTATETEQATCEGCGQKYGELKPEEKEVTVNGTIKQDTYVTSNKESGVSMSDTSMSNRTEINCNNGSNYRPIFEFNLAGALNSAELQANKDSAKVEFTFAIATGTADLFDADGAKFSIYGFLPGEGVSDVDFATLTWNSCKDTGANSQFYRKDTNANLSIIILNQTKDVASAYYTLSEVDGVLYITYTLDYTAIEHLICTTAGDNYGDIVMGFDFNKTIKFASMENETYAAPAVKVTYTK